MSEWRKNDFHSFFPMFGHFQLNVIPKGLISRCTSSKGWVLTPRTFICDCIDSLRYGSRCAVLMLWHGENPFEKRLIIGLFFFVFPSKSKMRCSTSWTCKCCFCTFFLAPSMGTLFPVTLNDKSKLGLSTFIAFTAFQQFTTSEKRIRIANVS